MSLTVHKRSKRLVFLLKSHGGTPCISLLFDSAILNFQDLLFWALKHTHLPGLSGTPNSMSCLHCKYQVKGSADKSFLVDTASVKLKFVISSSNSCLSTPHFVSLYYLSAGSLPRSQVTYQYHNLITQKPLGKITKRHSNHCDSTARGNVKSPSLLLLCHHAFGPWGGLLCFLPPLTSSSSSLTPWGKATNRCFLQGVWWQIHGQAHPHLITHKPLGRQMLSNWGMRTVIPLCSFIPELLTAVLKPFHCDYFHHVT